jgi:hypothetical protein
MRSVRGASAPYVHMYENLFMTARARAGLPFHRNSDDNGSDCSDPERSEHSSRTTAINTDIITSSSSDQYKKSSLVTNSGSGPSADVQRLREHLVQLLRALTHSA